MAQHNDTGRPAATLAPDASSPDRTPDRTAETLSIFSAPALEVVFQWWAESNRRWTEQNASKALMLPAVIRSESQ